MADQLQLRGGTTTEHNTFTGASKEVTVDTTKKTAVVHDGSTAGGNPLMREDGANSALALGSAGTPSLKWDSGTGIYSPGTDQVAVATNGAGRLFVDASGRVGVGKADPGATLEVWSDAPTYSFSAGTNPKANFAVINENNTAGQGSAIALGSTYTGSATVANARIFAPRDNTGATNAGAASLVFEVGQASGSALQERLRITSTGQLSHIGGGSSGSPAVGFNGSAPSNSLVVDSTGRVGIGTSSPSQLLTTVGNIKIAGAQAGNVAKLCLTRTDRSWTINNETDLRFRTSTGDTDSPATATVVFASNGNVGIGTTSPAELLELAATTDPKIQFTDVGNVISKIGISASTALTFEHNGSERARIDSSGTFRVKGAGTAGVNDAVQLNGSAPANSLLLDASGRLLVGTSTARSNFFNSSGLSPALQLESTSSEGRLASVVYNDADSASGPYLILGKTRATSNGASTRVSDNDEVGALSFQAGDGTDLVEAALIKAEVDGTPGANDMPGRLVFSTTAAGVTPIERMRITSEGRVVVSPDPAGTVTGSATQSRFLAIAATSTTGTVGIETSTGSTSTRYHVSFSNPNGVVGSISTNASATAYTTSSDYRLKENVTGVTDGITRLQQLKPSRFNFIADPDKTVDGFLAHEVQTIVPEAITGEKDAVDENGNPEYQGIDQSKLVPLLTAALQEAIGEIESLKARLTAAGL